MKKYRVMDGNEACAHISYMFTEVSGIYPITPASPMPEYIDKWILEGRKNIFNDEVKQVEMQSEAGAIALVHGSLQTGVLSSTYTASQGLLLMIPSMYKIAGEMLPCVINVASRTVATHALSIFGDHSDIYAARSTGFSFMASSSVQDVMYLTLVTYLSSIKGSLPFVNFFDGFRTSHELSKIHTLEIDDIKDLIDTKAINNFKKESMLINKKIKGTTQNDDIYFQNLEARNKYYDSMSDIVNEYMEKINEKFDLDYKPFNYYGDEKADKVIVAMGSVCQSIRELIDILNEKKEKVGLIEVHLYRPFSSKYFLNVLPKSVKKIAVLDRAKEAGSSGEPLYLDVVNIINKLNKKITVVGGRYGISSKDTTLSDLYAVYKNLDMEDMINSFTIGIKDDVTNKSLERVKIKNNAKNIEMKVYGFGSDGMVSATKDLTKLVGDNTKGFVQLYNEYDSKKSGGLTISHLRIGKDVIKSEYYIENEHIVVCTKESYLEKYDILNGIRKNGIFILVTDKKGDELEKILPDNIKYILSKKNINFFTVDAYSLSEKNNIPNKISMIMELAIIKITKVLPQALALTKMKESIKNHFTKKGEEIVNNNINAIENVDEYINKVEVKSEWSSIILKDKKYKGIIDNIEHFKGNELSVKEFLSHKDGSFPLDTSKLEKRDVSEYVPVWKSESCIQCNKCSIVCPHGVITPKILTYKEANLNKDLIVTDLLGKEGYKYALEINYDKCTGCGVCANTCVGKRGSKALEMIKKTLASRVNEKINVEYKNLFDESTIKGIGFIEPLFKYSGACAGCGQTPYIKLLTQVHKEGIIIANATGCSSIYGGSMPVTPYNVSWSNSLFEDNAEYGLGMRMTIKLMQEKIEKIMLENMDRVSNQNKELFKKWLDNKDNYNVTKEIKEKIDYTEVPKLKNLKEYIDSKSVWIIGGDGWSYDIGFSGIDHVMSSGENVNILVLDTEVYSNTGGQASKSTEKGAVAKFSLSGKKTSKKDLAKMMMNYENVYVAHISLGANILQALKTLKEAKEHDGPSLIIAYSPCISHGIKAGMKNMIEEEKLAVQSGYFPLFRYNGKEFNLDYKEPDFDLYDLFLEGENRYSMIKAVNSDLAKKLLEENKEEAKKRFEYYKSLSN